MGSDKHETVTEQSGAHIAGEVTFLVCIAKDDHSRIAARFAAHRARNSGGQVQLLHVMPPPEFQHWAAVGDLMREETRQEANELLEDIAGSVTPITGARPSLHVREGEIGEQILAHIADSDAIHLLVVGAAPPDQGHGSLVSWLAGQLAGQLRIPLVVVPGNLTDQELEELT